MDLRTLVTQITVFAGSLGLILAGLLLLGGHSRAAVGLSFGVLVGIANQIMIALRVARIGQLGSRKRTIAFIQAGTGMRFLMIGLAACIALKLPGVMDFFGLVAGLLLTMVVGTVVGARLVLR